MTVDEGLKAVRVWLDELGVYYAPGLARRALNRALLKFIEDVSLTFEIDAQARTRLIQLTPPPLKGRGDVADLPIRGILRIASVTVYFSDAVDDVGVSARPASKQTLAVSQNSYFSRPTQRHPLYVENKVATRRRLQFSGTVPLRWEVEYIAQPPSLINAPATLDLPVDETDAEYIVQLAVRFLQAQKAQDYNAQAQLEAQPSM